MEGRIQNTLSADSDQVQAPMVGAGPTDFGGDQLRNEYNTTGNLQDKVTSYELGRLDCPRRSGKESVSFSPGWRG